MKKILAKSVLAAAVTALSAGAFAGSLTVATPFNLATEIFGDGTNAGANAGSTQSSKETLITSPDAVYHISTTHTFAAADQATVKFTLGGNAVFGEDLSTIAKWGTNSTANVTFNYDTTVAAITAGTDIVDDVASLQYSVTVESGGAIGDNTIVFRITALAPGADVALKNVTLHGVKIKNLTSSLGAGSAHKQEISSEFRLLQSTPVVDSAAKKAIMTSSSALLGTFFLNANGTDWSATWSDVRQKIQVANGETSFTNSYGSSAGTDYNISNDLNVVDFGVLKVVKDTTVQKEDGSEFDIQASDDVKLTLTSKTKFLNSIDKIYLVSNGAGTAPASDCSGATSSSIFAAGSTATVSPLNADESDIVITLAQTSNQLGTNIPADSESSYLTAGGGYRVCVTSKNTAPTTLYAGSANKVVETVDSISAKANVEFYNARYFDVASSSVDLGGLTRNGCSVTLFNLPAVPLADDGFIRLTNLSSVATPGSVKATVWAEDGRLLDERVPVLNNLAAHATAVFHTDASVPTSGNKVNLGTALPKFGLETAGRARIVLTGAFPACEAMNMIRSNGLLINSTSTTYSGDSSKFSTDTNGTSNTTN